MTISQHIGYVLTLWYPSYKPPKTLAARHKELAPAGYYPKLGYFCSSKALMALHRCILRIRPVKRGGFLLVD